MRSKNCPEKRSHPCERSAVFVRTIRSERRGANDSPQRHGKYGVRMRTMVRTIPQYRSPFRPFPFLEGRGVERRGERVAQRAAPSRAKPRIFPRAPRSSVSSDGSILAAEVFDKRIYSPTVPM
jgi:hypothetical protein